MHLDGRAPCRLPALGMFWKGTEPIPGLPCPGVFHVSEVSLRHRLTTQPRPLKLHLQGHPPEVQEGGTFWGRKDPRFQGTGRLVSSGIRGEAVPLPHTISPLTANEKI